MLDPTRPESEPSVGSVVKLLVPEKVLLPLKVLASERRVEEANFQVEVEKEYTEPVELMARPPEERLVMAKFVVVALERKVLPASVVEERKLAKVELNNEETVVEPVTARAEVVAPVAERLLMVVIPPLLTERKVEVAVPAEEEAIAKSVDAA